MTYTSFTLSDLEEKFGTKHRFQDIDFKNKSIEPSQHLKLDIKESQSMPLKSEKARSEWIVVPILKELKRNNDDYFSIYSGDVLNVDKKRGLYGECDFVLTKNTQSFEINAPLYK
jgi:hypothetical protein